MNNKNTRKTKRSKRLTVVYALLMLFFSSVFVFSLYKIFTGVSEYKKADDVYHDLRDSFLSVNTEDEETSGEDVGTSTDGSDEAETSGESVWGTSHGTQTAPPAPKEDKLPVSVNFDALLAYNSDVVGWLYLEGTELNLPVVKTSDNEYYLRRDLSGKYLVTGTVFADFRCSTIGEDANYVIYGHDMKNDTIFGMLDEYARQDYYDAHPEIYFLTPSGDYKIEVYTGAIVPKDDRLYDVEAEGVDFLSYVKSLAASSGTVPHFELSENDKLVALSTCTDEYDGARFVVIGRAVKLGDGGAR